MFGTCRVDTEALCSEESSSLAGEKDFSELRTGESIVFLVAEVLILSNLQSGSLESGTIRCSSKEDVPMPSSNSLSFEQAKTKGSISMLRLGFSGS